MNCNFLHLIRGSAIEQLFNGASIQGLTLHNVTISDNMAEALSTGIPEETTFACDIRNGERTFIHFPHNSTHIEVRFPYKDPESKSVRHTESHRYETNPDDCRNLIQAWSLAILRMQFDSDGTQTQEWVVCGRNTFRTSVLLRNIKNGSYGEIQKPDKELWANAMSACSKPFLLPADKTAEARNSTFF